MVGLSRDGYIYNNMFIVTVLFIIMFIIESVDSISRDERDSP